MCSFSLPCPAPPTDLHEAKQRAPIVIQLSMAMQPSLAPVGGFGLQTDDKNRCIAVNIIL